MSEHTYGFVRDGKVYRKAQGDFPEREIGEVKESAEASLAYYEQRFQFLVEKIDQLEKDINETANKGSYLMKLLHLKSTLGEYDALGDFQPLEERLTRLEEYIRDTITQNRARNLEIKTALLAEAEALKEVTDWKAGAETAKDIKMRWIKTGSLEDEHQQEYEDKFRELIDDFFARRQAFFDDRQKMFEAREKQYQDLLERLRGLDAGKPESRDELRQIQQAWREVGTVPASSWKPLNQQYQYLTRPFKRSSPGTQSGGFRPGGRQRMRQESNPESLKARKEIVEKLESVEGHDAQAMRQVDALWEEHKALGPASGREANELTNRFFDRVNLLKEQNFLDRLVHQKVRNYEQRSSEEQKQAKARLLRDLLSRDERELALFRDNAEKFSGGQQRLNRQIENKLKMQERKVRIKRMILEELQ